MISIQQSELEAVASNYSGNQIWEKVLQQCLTQGRTNPDRFLEIFSNWMLYNDESIGSNAILGGGISKRKDLFNYHPPKPDALNYIPYLIAQHVISEVIVEYGDREQNGTSRLVTHREEAIKTFLDIAEFFGYKDRDEQFYALLWPYPSTQRTIMEVCRGYHIDGTSPSSRVGEALGFNFGGEYISIREFDIMDRVLHSHESGLARHLTEKDSYYYIKCHAGASGLEAEHTESAKKSIDYALNHFTGDKAAFKNDILRGLYMFCQTQQNFMEGLL